MKSRRKRRLVGWLRKLTYPRRVNNPPPERASCFQSVPQEEADMVKGVSRKVVVVKGPDDRFFDQAIFLVREDFISRMGISADQLCRQARQAADAYVRGVSQTRRERLSRLAPVLWSLLGAGAMGLLWLTITLIGI